MAAEDKVRFSAEMQEYSANQAAAIPPAENPYYHDPNAGALPYDSYAHHDPYAQYN